MSYSFVTHGLKPVRLLYSWNFPSKNTGVGYHFLLQGIFLTQGSNPRLLHWQADSLPLSHLGSPIQGLLAYIWLRIVSLMYVWLSQSDFESRDKFYTLCLL